jgi:hypothetical protein
VDLEVQQTPAKQAQKGGMCNPCKQPSQVMDRQLKGPVCGCPMQLKIVSDGEVIHPSSDKAGAMTWSTGKSCKLQHSETGLPILFVSDKQKTKNLLCCFSPPLASSFYPGYGGAASILDPEAEQFLNPTFKEPAVENEDDWHNDQEMTTIAQGLSSKMVEAKASEVFLFFILKSRPHLIMLTIHLNRDPHGSQTPWLRGLHQQVYSVHCKN